MYSPLCTTNISLRTDAVACSDVFLFYLTIWQRVQEQEQKCENECKAHNLVLVVNSKQFIIPYMQRGSNETVNWLLMRRINIGLINQYLLQLVIIPLHSSFTFQRWHYKVQTKLYTSPEWFNIKTFKIIFHVNLINMVFSTFLKFFCFLLVLYHYPS